MKGVFAQLPDPALARAIQAATARHRFEPVEVQDLLDDLWTEFLRRTGTALKRLSRSLSEADYSPARASADLLLQAIVHLETARVDDDWEANLFVTGYVSRAAIRQRASEEWSVHGTIDNPDVIRARFLIEDLMRGDIDSRVKEVAPVRGIRRTKALAAALAKELGQGTDSHHRLSVEQIEGYLAVRNFVSDGDVMTGTEMTVFDLFGAHHEDTYDLDWYKVLLRIITPRELEVLRHTFGIETEMLESQAAIGSLMGCGQKTVSRALESGTEKLRAVGRERLHRIVYFGEIDGWYEALLLVVNRRELAVLRHTYGIETPAVTSQQEIASLMGIKVPEVVRALESAQEKLAQPENARYRSLLTTDEFELAA